MKKVAVVGATGLVGRLIINLLEKRNFPISQLYPVASKKSCGKKIFFKNKKIKVISLLDCLEYKPDIVLFSAGAEISKIWAPKFSKLGSIVIDNSSAWRMDTSKKLIVPEINGLELSKKDKIIANPNCSTIQLVMVLYPLHKLSKIKRVVVSTYQSVTGSGKKGIDQLNQEKDNNDNIEKVYPYNIFQNAIPQCDVFVKKYHLYTKEEIKIIEETKKILNDNKIRITSTAVRIPVVGGHSESVNIEFHKKIELKEIIQVLKKTKGIIVQDNIEKSIYPMPITAQGKDDVFVGRIRRDFSNKNSINLWIVSDNLRKGAATNTIQIAEKVINYV